MFRSIYISTYTICFLFLVNSCTQRSNEKYSNNELEQLSKTYVWKIIEPTTNTQKVLDLIISDLNNCKKNYINNVIFSIYTSSDNSRMTIYPIEKDVKELPFIKCVFSYRKYVFIYNDEIIEPLFLDTKSVYKYKTRKHNIPIDIDDTNYYGFWEHLILKDSLINIGFSFCDTTWRDEKYVIDED